MAPKDDKPAGRGARLITLRHMDGLTQTALAAKLGVTQGFVSQVEKGTKPLPSDLAEQAAATFGLPVEFFSVPADVTEAGTTTFRKSSKASVMDQNLVTAAFGEAARLFRIASERSGHHPADLITPLGEDVEETASNLRSILGLGPTDAIANATRAAERLGVGVIHGIVPVTQEATTDHHGITRPNMLTDRPLIGLVGQQPPHAARLTVMHELAHLIYDRDRDVPIRGTRSPEERRAFRFAGAMLIPASVVRERISETLTLHGYLRIKADYGISVAALIVRAVDLNVISAARSRSLFIQLSSQGWRRNEPVPVAKEHALLLPQAARHGISADPSVIAKHTGVRYAQVEQWTGLSRPQAPMENVIPLRRP